MFSNKRDTKHVSRNTPVDQIRRRGRVGSDGSAASGQRWRFLSQEVSVMKKLIARASIIAVSAMLAFASAAHAQTKTITLCWAAWDPANALVELSKDFTTKTGIQMKFEFVPWPNFADWFLNELNSKGKLCDLMIGDS